jgi:hypothetical protein
MEVLILRDLQTVAGRSNNAFAFAIIAQKKPQGSEDSALRYRWLSIVRRFVLWGWY